MRYRGMIRPGRCRPRSFSFWKAEEPSRFGVLLFTDPHAKSAAAIDFIRTDVPRADVGTQKQDFGAVRQDDTTPLGD
jgi:hypothetical protein